MIAPRIIGLDASLTSTGVALPSGATVIWSPKERGVERLAEFRSLLEDVMFDIDLVVIEDYAFSGRGAHSHELGELGGVIRLVLHDNGRPWVAVLPNVLKKFATGSGVASKNEMLAAAIRRLGYDGHSDDEADALWLRAAALDHYGYPVVDMPAVNRAALDKIAWPELAQ